MKQVKFFAVVLVLVSCQIEDEGAPSPESTFIKYYGELTNYEAVDIEIDYDASGEIPEALVIFGNKLNPAGDRDYFILRTDLSGNLIDSASYGVVVEGEDFNNDGTIDNFIGDEDGAQIEVLSGGGYAIIGTSREEEIGLTYISRGIINDDLGLEDEALTEIFADNSDLAIEAADIIELSDNDLLIVGAMQVGDLGSAHFDGYYLRIDLNTGEEVFRSIIGVPGTDEDERPVRAFEKESGNIVIIGSSRVPSSLGENDGSNGRNVFYLEMDENGTPLNAASYGLDPLEGTDALDEEVSDVIRTDNGFFVTGTSFIGLNTYSAFVMRLGVNGSFFSGNNHDSSIFTSIRTEGIGLVSAANGNPIVLGRYPNFSFTDPTSNQSISRNGEGMFAQFDQFSRPVTSAEKSHGLSDGNDVLVDAVRLPDGKIIAVGNVDFGGGIRLITILKMNANGTLD